MNTPEHMLEAMNAVQRLGKCDMNDGVAVSAAMYELGYEREGVWFFDWEEGADVSDSNAKLELNREKYEQALSDLQKYIAN
jgi:hypothetical protein